MSTIVTVASLLVIRSATSDIVAVASLLFIRSALSYRSYANQLSSKTTEIH